MNNIKKLDASFFQRDVLEVAPDLVGKVIVRRMTNGSIKKFRITETEAYRGEEDKACHASKGRTPRTEAMYHHGGKIYVYLIYGMHWMLNIVAGTQDEPQAVLIRAIEGNIGPGKVGQVLEIDKSLYDVDISVSDQIWIEDDCKKYSIATMTRVGIDYAGEKWKNKKWRFVADRLIDGNN